MIAFALVVALAPGATPAHAEHTALIVLEHAGDRDERGSLAASVNAALAVAGYRASDASPVWLAIRGLNHVSALDDDPPRALPANFAAPVREGAQTCRALASASEAFGACVFGLEAALWQRYLDEVKPDLVVSVDAGERATQVTTYAPRAANERNLVALDQPAADVVARALAGEGRWQERRVVTEVPAIEELAADAPVVFGTAAPKAPSALARCRDLPQAIGVRATDAKLAADVSRRYDEIIRLAPSHMHPKLTCSLVRVRSAGFFLDCDDGARNFGDTPKTAVFALVARLCDDSGR